jgi:hypothetical protein
VGNSAYYGAGGDDVEIGLRIYAARRTRPHHAAPGAANRSGPRSGAEPARRRRIRYVSDAVIDTSGERALATYRSGHTVIETWDDFNKGPYGYRERSTGSKAALTLPERFDPSAIIDRIERNFNELTMAWYTDPALVDTALRCIIGSEDNEGRAVYRIESSDGGTRIRFTKPGRDWIVYRLNNTRHGVSDPYGRRLRRALYGEAATRRRTAPRLVSAL